jgi:hypothetical protein
MVDYTDFKAGLQNVNDYLDGKHHLSGTVSAGVDAARIVVGAEYSFTMREIMCGILSGNGVKLPNLQLNLKCSLDALLAQPLNMQQEVLDAITQAGEALNDFMDHTKLDEVLGRANLILAEAQQVASLLNFCAKPIDPVAIPNMLERSFGSFLGPGQKIMNDLGQLAPNMDVNLCGQAFNPNAFVGGLLGEIGARIDDVLAGALPLNEIASLVSRAEALRTEVSNLIAFENNITGAHDLGGSNFTQSTTEYQTSDRVGVMHNPGSGNVASNAGIANSMKSLYDNLAGYPVQYVDPDSGEVEEYANIFELLFDDEILDILKRDDEPLPTVSNQVPVYDYCGNIKGYREVFEQRDQQTSDGAEPAELSNNPGYNAGGYSTFASGEGSSTTSNTTIVYNTTTGSSSAVHIVGSESGQLALSLNAGDIVVRSDILTSYVKKNTSTQTMSDFQQMNETFSAFLKSLRNLSSSGIVVKNGDTALTRGVYGTQNQVVVNNSTGAGGDVIVRLADNAIVPGNDSLKIPVGTTLQRASSEPGRIRYNTDTNKIEAYFSHVAQWLEIGQGSGNTGSGIADITNIGTGSEIFKQNNLITGESELRKLNASGAITVTQNADDITIGEQLAAENIGNEVELLSGRVGNTFQFKTLVGDSTVNVANTGNTVTISNPGLLKATASTTTASITTDVLFDGTLPQPATDESWFFTVKAIGKSPTTNQTRTFKIEGTVQNVGGTTTMIGTPVRTDYQRDTQESNYDLWNAATTYNAGDIVEYDYKLWKVDTGQTVNPFENDPANNTKFVLHYDGWNVTASVFSNSFRITTKGDDVTDVNWAVSLEILDII